MSEEGIKFVTGTNIGIDIKHDELLDSFDAICLSGGSTIPRDLPIPGRDLKGVYFAMEYLSQQNKELSGEYIDSDEKISAEGKKVVIIGGGVIGLSIGWQLAKNSFDVTIDAISLAIDKKL